METPPSPLALFVRRALDPEKSRAPAFAWHSFERDPVTWSYARTYRAAAAAAAKVSNVTGARGAPPPKVSPLQTSPEHRAHCVGVFVSEGPGLLLLTLAVGLCGCAFVPLSKHDPPRRLAAAMRDAAVSLAVVDDDFAARRARDALAILSRDETSGGTESDALEVRVLNLSELLDVGAFEDASSAESGDDATRLKTETNAFPTETDALVLELADLDLDACLERHPDRVSHVFFTSGSTGTPKGCVATRSALAWFAEGKKQTHELDFSSVVLVASPHVFDPSLGDFYASLASGGCVALCPEARLKSNLGLCLLKTKATHLTTTPTALGSVVLNENDAKESLDAKGDFKNASSRSAFPYLRVVALGGEPTPRSLADAWLGRVPVLANTYGVTECCVYQTFSKMEINDPETRRRLGDAFPGARMIHAAPPGDDPANEARVDETSSRDLSPLRVSRLPDDDAEKSEKSENDSSLAELWLGGPQVGLGYAGDPKLTDARFKVVLHADGSEERLFRTGDITKLVPGVGRVLVGRGDGQVKIRGRRVELGEIEAAMRECLADVLSDVAVTATGKKNADGGSDGALVAWAVARDEQKKTKKAETHESDVSDASSLSYSTPTATTCDAMRYVLSSSVPEYMLPARFAFIRAARLPITASGKTARRVLARLPPPPPPDRGHGKDASRTNSRRFSRRERALASIVKHAWSTELGVPPHAIERASRFAELGGDSMVAARVCRAVHAATLGKNTNGAEDVGAHGEFLTGALAPASLAGDISLGAFVSRIAADLRTGLETDADGNDDEEEEEKEEEEDDDFSSDRLGSDDESAAAGVSLLYRAAREDAAGIVRALLRSGVPVDGWRTSARGVTNDAQEGASSVARNKTKTKTKTKNQKEALFASSPLHAACAAGAEATVLVLLERGALPNARARRGATPLHLAAAAAKPFSVEGLRRVLAFADGAEKTSASNESAFSELKTTHSARRDGRDKRLSALASLDDDRQSVLHYAARVGTSATITEWLIDTAETLHGQKRMGATSLRGSGVELHQSENAFAESRDVGGRTAMHWAALNGHRAVVAALLHRGASRSVADANGETPVQLAERRALCSARDRPDGERASRWGDVAALLGGAGTTKHLKKSLAP